ncbi:hypothetical protein BGZ92_006905, partial [Podila epicladia]
MSKRPWRDDELRLEAENLISRFGHLWPTRCDNPLCTQPFPHSFRKDQAKSGLHSVWRFRCSGCKNTLSVKVVLATLQSFPQVHAAGAPAMSAIPQPPLPVLMPAAPVSQNRASVPPHKSIPVNRSLHVSDLDSLHEDTDMSDSESEEDDDAHVSPL